MVELGIKSRQPKSRAHALNQPFLPPRGIRFGQLEDRNKDIPDKENKN